MAAERAGRTACWEIDKRELLDLVMDDPAVAWADIEVARPAESARIIRICDVIEPKIKVEGPGVTYPGIAGRPVAIAGRGRTHRLGGMTIMPCSEMPERNTDGTRWRAQTDVPRARTRRTGTGYSRPLYSLESFPPAKIFWLRRVRRELANGGTESGENSRDHPASGCGQVVAMGPGDLRMRPCARRRRSLRLTRAERRRASWSVLAGWGKKIRCRSSPSTTMPHSLAFAGHRLGPVPHRGFQDFAFAGPIR